MELYQYSRDLALWLMFGNSPIDWFEEAQIHFWLPVFLMIPVHSFVNLGIVETIFAVPSCFILC